MGSDSFSVNTIKATQGLCFYSKRDYVPVFRRRLVPDVLSIILLRGDWKGGGNPQPGICYTQIYHMQHCPKCEKGYIREVQLLVPVVKCSRKDCDYIVLAKVDKNKKDSVLELDVDNSLR
jgi:hypothetical protein